MRVRPLQPKESADWVVVGQIGAPYGVKGWNHARAFTNPVDSLLTYNPWFVKQKDGWVQVECETGRRHGEGLVIKLKGIEDRDQAATLTQANIAIKRSQRESLPENVFYWTDLEGLSVELTTGESWGQVRYLYDNAGTDVMIIDHDGKEYHVPFIMNDTVVKVDLAARQIVIDWSFDYPEG